MPFIHIYKTSTLQKDHKGRDHGRPEGQAQGHRKEAVYLWTSWSMSGSWIIGDPDIPAVRKITETDNVGREILSYIPLSLIEDFLSVSGQTFVSHSELHYIFSVLINNLDNPPDQHFNDVHLIISCKSPSEQCLHNLWPQLQTDLVPFKVRQRICQRASDASGSKIDPRR